MTTTMTPKKTPEEVKGRAKRSPALWTFLAVLGVVLIGAVLWLAFGGSNVSIEDETAALEQMMIEQEAAQNRIDEDAMIAMLADDAVVQINDLPAAIGPNALRQAYAGIWPVFVSTDMAVSKTVVSESGDMAWMYGTQVNELDLPDAGRISVPGKWMVVTEKIDGEWKVTALSVGPVSEQPQP